MSSNRAYWLFVLGGSALIGLFIYNGWKTSNGFTTANASGNPSAVPNTASAGL